MVRVREGWGGMGLGRGGVGRVEYGRLGKGWGRVGVWVG